MRIGLDIDGVLADFSRAAAAVFVSVTGRNLIPVNFGDLTVPVWLWWEHYGYTKDEARTALDYIHRSSDFWLNLWPLPDANTLRFLLSGFERQHELYFITRRDGDRVKRQTELWLFDHLKYPINVSGVWPTVLIVGYREKGAMAKALQLDIYVDDNCDNANDVVRQSPATRMYLVSRAHNQGVGGIEPAVTRVGTLGEVFDTEHAKGTL